MNESSSFKDIIDILACPKCLGSLELAEKETGTGLICPVCAVVYPVREGIPVLLVEEALSMREWDTQTDD